MSSFCGGFLKMKVKDLDNMDVVEIGNVIIGICKEIGDKKEWNPFELDLYIRDLEVTIERWKKV